jgi:hypothetical protein
MATKGITVHAIRHLLAHAVFLRPRPWKLLWQWLNRRMRHNNDAPRAHYRRAAHRQLLVLGESRMMDGRLRAWIESPESEPGRMAAYVGVPPGSNIPLRRLPATGHCASQAEAKQWVEREAHAVLSSPRGGI